MGKGMAQFEEETLVASNTFRMAIYPTTLNLLQESLDLIRRTAISELKSVQVESGLPYTFNKTKIVFQEAKFQPENDLTIIRFFALTTQIATSLPAGTSFQEIRTQNAESRQMAFDGFVLTTVSSPLFIEKLRQGADGNGVGSSVGVTPEAASQILDIISIAVASTVAPMNTLDNDSIVNNPNSLSKVDVILIVVIVLIFYGMIIIAFYFHRSKRSNTVAMGDANAEAGRSSTENFRAPFPHIKTGSSPEVVLHIKAGSSPSPEVVLQEVSDSPTSSNNSNEADVDLNITQASRISMKKSNTQPSEKIQYARITELSKVLSAVNNVLPGSMICDKDKDETRSIQDNTLDVTLCSDTLPEGMSICTDLCEEEDVNGNNGCVDCSGMSTNCNDSTSSPLKNTACSITSHCKSNNSDDTPSLCTAVGSTKSLASTSGVLSVTSVESIHEEIKASIYASNAALCTLSLSKSGSALYLDDDFSDVVAELLKTVPTYDILADSKQSRIDYDKSKIDSIPEANIRTESLVEAFFEETFTSEIFESSQSTESAKNPRNRSSSNGGCSSSGSYYSDGSTSTEDLFKIDFEKCIPERKQTDPTEISEWMKSIHVVSESSTDSKTTASSHDRTSISSLTARSTAASVGMSSLELSLSRLDRLKAKFTVVEEEDDDNGEV